jgi:hypothetical protein
MARRRRGDPIVAQPNYARDFDILSYCSLQSAPWELPMAPQTNCCILYVAPAQQEGLVTIGD